MGISAFRLKMAAAAEKKTVRDLLLKLIADKIPGAREEGAVAEGEELNG